MVKKKFLITSALPYVNGVKHLGNLAGSLLPADVYTRFLKATDRDALYISATDEHGTPTELAAAAVRQTPAEYSAINHDIQKDIYERFGIDFDFFGRTSSPQNHELTKHFARAIHNNGYAEIRTTRQIYSVDDQRFLPDRYVTGTCPKCKYGSARGDQCENCSSVLDPEDLIHPRSTISGSPNLEFRDSKHLFIKLPMLSDKVREWVDKNDQWPSLVKSIAYKWLNEGLQERSITRDLHWGIPVNIEGLEGKVFYVWFDAPIGYISATQEWADADPDNRDWQSYWYDADDTVHYVQFMAKDNIPFHTVSFPAMQIASGEPWKKVDFLKGFNWLNYYGEKFSTSQKRGVFTSDALDIFPADYWRYYLMARSPENSDSTFTWEDFQQVINSDLSNVLGNFVNRVMKFTETRFDGVVPEAGSFTGIEERYMDALEALAAEYTQHMESTEFRKSADTLRSIWSLGNQYFAESAPWSAIKTDPARAGNIINFALNYIGMVAQLSQPMIPHTTRTIESALPLKQDRATWFRDRSQFHTAMPGRAIQPLDLLFSRIDNDQIAALRERFSGSENQTITQPVFQNLAQPKAQMS